MKIEPFHSFNLEWNRFILLRSSTKHILKKNTSSTARGDLPITIREVQASLLHNVFVRIRLTSIILDLIKQHYV